MTTVSLYIGSHIRSVLLRNSLSFSEDKGSRTKNYYSLSLSCSQAQQFPEVSEVKALGGCAHLVAASSGSAKFWRHVQPDNEIVSHSSDRV